MYEWYRPEGTWNIVIHDPKDPKTPVFQGPILIGFIVLLLLNAWHYKIPILVIIFIIAVVTKLIGLW